MYKIELNNVSIYDKVLPGVNPGEPDITLSEDESTSSEVVTVEFDIEIDARSWGIKSLSPTVRKIFLNCIIEREDGNYEDYQKDLSDFELESEEGDSHNKYPTDVDINFRRKKIIVTF